MKRFLDLSLVVLTMPIWLPIMCATAIAVKIKMGSPVFFKQKRAGLNGMEFDIVKFRTMLNGEGSDEERLTRFGRFLRASSLDELPELLLVIKGTMSLVGPRPLPTKYLPRYSAQQMRRHEVVPGITGWAQVNGRNLLSWEDKFRYDVWYVDHHSIAIDFKILFLTVLTVVARKGISAHGEATMTEFIG